MEPTASSLIDDFATAWPIIDWGDVNVLVGVSGGSDSVALLRLLLHARQHHAAQVGSLTLPPSCGRLIVAHFDHQMRPNSAFDANWVEYLSDKLGLTCHIGRTGSSALCTEQAARKARYQFFEKVAAMEGARFVATGHTADDQAETIMHHIVRGTGIAGLAGISRVRPLNPSLSLIRPLLSFRRTTLRAYLVESDQEFREDETNEDTSFTRNRIRHELIPHLQQNYNAEIVPA